MRSYNYFDSMVPEYGSNKCERIFSNRHENGSIEEFVPENLDSNQDLSVVENNKLSELRGNIRVDQIIKTLNMDHLDRQDFSAIEVIMAEYSDIFYLQGDRLTITDAAVHDIETTTMVPINKRQYRFAESTKKQINEEIDEMLRQGIIKYSTSPWNAPVLCIPKKGLNADGSKKYRIVVDFRDLNIITKPFVHPIPRIDEILDNLGDSIYFTTLDLKSGFYQVPINPRDAAKTAFSTPKGHFEFTRMPMGLRNSPSTFQRLMNTVLYELKDIKAIVYLDDIIIYGKTTAEHNQNLVRVLEALRKHNLKVEPSKCQILRTEINYLGHTVNRNGIHPTQDNIKAVRNMPVPKTVKGVRSFLGTVNFYGKFIPSIAEIRKPLNDLLKKNARFKWTEECQKAFEKLRDFLTSDTLLVRPNYKDTFVITTDASDHAIGAVLSNEKTTNRPIAYASRGLVGAETRYHIIEKELLAIVWAVNHFKHYIYNQKFIVYTDHRPLISIWHLKESSSTLTRLRLKLQGLELDIRYKHGRDNIVADFLSRMDYENKHKDMNQAAVVTRQQRRIQKQMEESKDTESDINSPSRTGKSSDWNQNMDRLNEIAISIDKNQESNNHITYEKFENAKLNGQIDVNRLKYTDTKIEEDETDATFIILNKRTAFKELSGFVDLPHGLKDYLTGNMFAIPNRKIWGILLNGSSRTKNDTKVLFDNLMDAFSNGPNYSINAKNIFMISFRNIQSPFEVDILNYISEKFDKTITIYTHDNNRMWVPVEKRDIVLREFHDCPLGGHVGSKRMMKRISPLFKWTNMRRDVENYVLVLVKNCNHCGEGHTRSLSSQVSRQPS